MNRLWVPCCTTYLVMRKKTFHVSNHIIAVVITDESQALNRVANMLVRFYFQICRQIYGRLYNLGISIENS